jgi:hypothetical protein
MLVTPVRNWLYIGHPDIVMEIVRRRDDFPRCVELTQVLDVFGPNVSSVNASLSNFPLYISKRQWLTHHSSG